MTKIDFNAAAPVTENFLGLGGVYHGYAGMPDDSGRVYSEELCEIEADRAAILGLKIARTFYSWYAWDSENACWNWDSERMTVFYRWLARMQKRGIDVAINTGWCFPGDINSTSWNGKSPFTVEGDWDKSVQNYADWVSETLHQIIEVRGFTNVKYIHLFTEPQYYVGRVLPNGEKDTYKIYCQTVKVVHNTLIRDNRRNLVKIIGPNEGSTSASHLNRYVAKNADECIDIYSSHNYQDFLVPENTPKLPPVSGLTMWVPGARCWQYATLKKNTDYKVTVSIIPDIEDMLTVSGSFSFGAFSVDEKLNNSIQSGGSKTNRLNEKSLKMVDAAELKNGEENLLEYTFNSLDATETFIGAFNDIKGAENTVFIQLLDLKEVGSDKGILKNSDLSKLTDGDLTVFSRDPYNPAGWNVIGVKGYCPSPYFFIQNCVTTSLNSIPKNKPFWFDEYNVRCEYKNFSSPLHGTHLAALMLALANSGAENSLMWTLFDQQWPNNHTTNNDAFVDGDHRYGVMPVLTRSLVPYPAYYAAGILMKNLGGGEGTKILPYNGDGIVVGTLSLGTNGEIAIAVVNNKSTEESLEIAFDEIKGRTLARTLYDPKTVFPDNSGNLPMPDRTFVVEGVLTDTLPPFAVAVYKG